MPLPLPLPLPLLLLVLVLGVLLLLVLLLLVLLLLVMLLRLLLLLLMMFLVPPALLVVLLLLLLLLLMPAISTRPLSGSTTLSQLYNNLARILLTIKLEPLGPKNLLDGRFDLRDPTRRMVPLANNHIDMVIATLPRSPQPRFQNLFRFLYI